jgi:hypothetical protein
MPDNNFKVITAKQRDDQSYRAALARKDGSEWIILLDTNYREGLVTVDAALLCLHMMICERVGDWMIQKGNQNRPPP